jgi:hypothetical protein
MASASAATASSNNNESDVAVDRSESILWKAFVDCDSDGLNQFLLRQKNNLQQQPSRRVPAEVLAFVDAVLSHANINYKIYALLVLMRSDPAIAMLVAEAELPQVSQKFIPILEVEYDRFLTGLKPDDGSKYVMDDINETNRKSVPFLIQRLRIHYLAL